MSSDSLEAVIVMSAEEETLWMAAPKTWFRDTKRICLFGVLMVGWTLFSTNTTKHNSFARSLCTQHRLSLDASVYIVIDF